MASLGGLQPARGRCCHRPPEPCSLAPAQLRVANGRARAGPDFIPGGRRPLEPEPALTTGDDGRRLLGLSARPCRGGGERGRSAALARQAAGNARCLLRGRPSRGGAPRDCVQKHLSPLCLGIFQGPPGSAEQGARTPRGAAAAREPGGPVRLEREGCLARGASAASPRGVATVSGLRGPAARDTGARTGGSAEGAGELDSGLRSCSGGRSPRRLKLPLSPPTPHSVLTGTA
ncbi:PREDICTED: uncharacterized protein LOC105812535 [Propithecus coquereli]|uniref:uncharacterized protein LOC105812535 n=1 Tax=Propithecus coquereli TaxID=379532 RepID=UPI00063F946E|nr:PREDICTED: uncharacterized protein LOC105812535 [Propithecus coquereli]